MTTGETRTTAIGPLVTLESIRTAAAGLAEVAVRTPLVNAPELGRLAGAEVRLKCENLQPIGAFKIRGAYTALSRLPVAERARGVVTHSSGNHGQAVAFAARLLGIRAVVVMPRQAARVKVEAVQRYGGEVVFVTNPSERDAKAVELAATQGLVLVPPYEYHDVIAGQGTCGLEILEQWPAVECILVPVGGGGLLAGVATAVAGLRPATRVIGVEPAVVPKLSAALAAGAPTPIPRAESLADGLLPVAVGRLPFAHFHGVVKQAVQVTEDDLVRAMRFLHQQMGLRVEPSGAATVAALLSGRVRPGGPTVAILSGGNVDPELFQRLVTE